MNIDHYTVNLENPKSWDEYWYGVSRQAASNSKCLSRKIGATITTYDNSQISVGYNGPPRGIRTCDRRWFIDPDMREHAYKKSGNTKFIETLDEEEGFYKEHLCGKCPRYVPEMGYKSGEGLEWCVAGHAERSSIVNAAREGMPALKGLRMFMTCGVPCTPCLVEIINAGIEEIIITAESYYDQSSWYLLKESNLKVRRYDFMKDR